MTIGATLYLDLLLLNCTNLPWRPIFPYAFVQVSAVARRNGKSVRTVDLLGVPRERWEPLIASLVKDSRPRMIGLHIRQGDSVFLDDYFSPPGSPSTTRNFFPIDDNRELVKIARGVSTAPVIAGGFGFTTHARRLFDHLGVDYGVQGCPDDVFARFDDVIDGRGLSTIANLIYRDGGSAQLNERAFYAPFEGREYDDAMFDELVRFYGHSQLFGPNATPIPIEIMRGCPFSCFFCTEPAVKGRGLRYRDLDVIEAELDFLLHRQLRRFWMICSELDIQGTKFALTLAERIVRLQERHGGAPIEWSAFTLPRLEEDELRLLQRAGYVGALNDVLSLDDDNLRRARVPYRSKQAVAFLKAVTKLDREDTAAAANADVAELKLQSGLTHRTPRELAAAIGLFFGNAEASATTIATTLRRFEDEGLRENYRAGLVIPSTRVFEPDGQPICATTKRGLRTYTPDGEAREIDAIHPTFYFSDFLMERLGTPGAIVEFFRYVADTFMSVAHRSRKDWGWFLSQHITIDAFTRLLASAGPRFDPDPIVREVTEEPTLARLRNLYAPSAPMKAAWNAAAKVVIDHVIARHADQAARVRDALAIADGLNEYRLIERLYAQFDSREAVVAAVSPRDDAERFYLDWLLYANNVVLRPSYRELLFG